MQLCFNQAIKELLKVDFFEKLDPVRSLFLAGLVLLLRLTTCRARRASPLHPRAGSIRGGLSYKRGAKSFKN